GGGGGYGAEGDVAQRRDGDQRGDGDHRLGEGAHRPRPRPTGGGQHVGAEVGVLVGGGAVPADDDGEDVVLHRPRLDLQAEQLAFVHPAQQQREVLHDGLV